MERSAKGYTVEHLALGIIALAIGCAWFLVKLYPLASLSTTMLGILGGMALLAEFLPVEFSRRGVRITFTLPYIAAVAVAVSPAAAMVLDIAVTLVAGVLYPVVRKRRTPFSWLSLNAAVAAVCATAGSIAAQTVLVGGYTARALGFLAGYGAANLLLVASIDWATTRRPLTENVLSTLNVGLRAFALYAVIALATVVLTHRGLVWFIPLTLVPVWTLRTGLEYKARMYDHYYETISALSLMLQRAHPYTHGHLERVAADAEEVASRLGLSPERARLVREAAVLHDIGKIAVSEVILDKPAKLTEEEMDHVRRHAEMGAKILAPVKQFQPMVPWILHHHERPDGKGYPHRLTDADIPIESKIIAVVDAFDAMTGGDATAEKRSYRDPMTIDEALAELERCSGTQFDPRVVQAFREVILEENA